MFEHLLARAPAVLGLAFVVYLCVVAIYRLTFHPLAKYPGPFWGRITSWQEGISAWRLRRHVDLDRLHQQYGDVVRFSPNKLSFRSAQAWHDIYTDRHANVIKTGFTDASININQTVHTQSIPDRNLYTARRKLLNHAFSESALRGLEPRVVQKIREWCGFLETGDTGNATKVPEKGTQQWSGRLDMGQWSSFLTTDILSQVCFSQDIDACKNAGSEWDDSLPGTVGMTSKVCHLPIRWLLYPLIRSEKLMSTGIFPGGRESYRFKASAARCIAKRFALEETEKNYSESARSKDFFHHLLNGNNPETGQKFEPRELVGEAVLLVVAGSDTSSTALSATFHYLLHNERVLNKLKEEVRGSFTDVEQITYHGSKLKDLVYLRACIEEAIRLSPPVPTLMDRLILPGGAKIDGGFVPEGVTVGVPIYTLHHNERYFENPYSYVPERWIEGSPSSETGFLSTVTEAQIETARGAWVPFSTGLRGCVGRGLAYMELTMALARVIYQFDIREAQSQGIVLEKRDMGGAQDDKKGEYQLRDVFVAQRDGPMMEFKRLQQ